MYSLYTQPAIASAEGEQSVLNGLMRYPSITPELLSMVEASDFYYHGYAGVFAALKHMHEKGIPFNIETVIGFLKDSPEYKDVVYGYGDNTIDAATLSDIYSMAVLGASATWSAGRVKDLSRKRVLIKAFEKGIEDAHILTISSDEVQKKFEERLNSMAYAESSNEIDDIASSQSVLDGLFEPEQDIFPTGLIDLDQLLNGGIRPKQVMVVGARPGMGKSMLGLSLADNWARLGKNVFFLTIEMTAKEMAERRLSFTAGIPLSLLREGASKLPDVAITQLRQAHQQIAKYPGRIIFNEDKLSPSGLHLRCKALKAKGKLDAIVIDYLQIMRPDKALDSQVQSIGLIAYAIKDIAKELNVPVVALAQLNREVSRRGDKPMVTDLRESGAIEQMADVVLLIHREPIEGDVAPQLENVDLIIGKNRSGNRGTAHVLCDSRIMRFANLARGGM